MHLWLAATPLEEVVESQVRRVKIYLGEGSGERTAEIDRGVEGGRKRKRDASGKMRKKVVWEGW